MVTKKQEKQETQVAILPPKKVRGTATIKALDRQFISGQNGDGGHRCVAKKQGPPTSGTTWTGPKGVTVDDVTT